LSFIWLPDASKHLHPVPISPGLQVILSEVLFEGFCPGEWRGKYLQIDLLLNPYLLTIHDHQIEFVPCLKPYLYEPKLLIQIKLLYKALYLIEIREMRVGDSHELKKYLFELQIYFFWMWSTQIIQGTMKTSIVYTCYSNVKCNNSVRFTYSVHTQGSHKLCHIM